MRDYFHLEWVITIRKWPILLMPFVFFMFIMTIAPFTLGQDITKTSTAIMPSIVWISLILSSLLSIGHSFERDIQDGFIDRYVLFNIPYESIFIIKSFIAYLTKILPLCVIGSFMSFLYGFETDFIVRMNIMMMITALSFIFFGVFGSLLNIGKNNHHHDGGGGLIFILIFPLLIPAIIFGAGGTDLSVDLLQAVKLPLGFALFSMAVTSFAARFLILNILAER